MSSDPFAQVTEREAIWATQAESQSGSDAVAPVLGNITPGKLRIVSHHVQAESGPAAERLQRPVQIGCDPLSLVGAEVHSASQERVGLGSFRFLIDDAAGRTPAEGDR